MACRVVHLTSVHYPFDTRIFHRECGSLAKAGFDTTLIAPSAEEGAQANGVKLRAVVPPSNRRERMTHTTRRVYAAALRENAKIYHFHDPELLPVGALLKLHGKKIIYDVHEDYKGTMEGKQWIPASLSKAASVGIEVGEAAMSSFCDRVVAATPTIARKFPESKTCLVQNFPMQNELRKEDASSYEERELIAVYVGWLGDHSGVESMREAHKIVSREMPMRLLLGGKVIAGAKADFQKNTEDNGIEFLGFLNRPRIADIFAQSRIGLVTVLPSGNSFHAQPTKMFEYMSASLPVIASDFPVYRKFVEDARCGLLVDPLNPQKIAESILWMLRNPAQAAEMGRNGRRAIEDRYNWEREAEKLVAMYMELAAQ